MRIPSVETLECRNLFSTVTASVSSRGTLVVTGSPQGDTITVDRDAAAVRVLDGSIVVGTFAVESVRRLSIAAGAGNDDVRVGFPVRATLDGGAGDDTVVGSRADDTFVAGGGGVNTVDGVGGNDVVIAGGALFNPEGFDDSVLIVASDDMFYFQPRGVLTIVGDGRDNSFTGRALFALRVDGGGGNDYFEIEDDGFGPPFGVTLDGGAGDDRFALYDDTDGEKFTIRGGGGDDVVDDRIGSADLDLGDGYDVLDQGNLIGGSTQFSLPPGVEEFRMPAIFVDGGVQVTGNDEDNLIVTQRSPATLIGNGGDDTLVGGGADDLLVGGPGDDSLDAQGGNDTVTGGDGRDTLRGGDGSDRLDGGPGDDYLLGEGGRDTVNGNSGNDSLHGGSNYDRLFGGTGDDTLTGGGRDLLDGQAGNDLLYARDGLIDTLFGGGGFDRARRDFSAGVKDLVDGIEAFV